MIPRFIVMVVMVVLLVMSIDCARADADTGQAAFERGDYATALRLWRPMAESGDRPAQLGLATLYFNGRGVSRDYPEAIRWYRKAAQQGAADAQAVLGTAYEEGLYGLEADLPQAAEWYREAALQGHGAAAFALGLLYSEGKGVTQDDGEAARWYLMSAERGPDHHQYSAALYALGVVYEKGKGVEADIVEAHKWYDLAAGSDQTMNLGWFWWAAQARSEVAAKMSPDQIAASKNAAQHWMAARAAR